MNEKLIGRENTAVAVEAQEGLMNWESLKMSASQEVETELATRLQKFEGTVADRIFVLLQIMAEYGETKPGTIRPIDNSKRFHVEAVAELLKQAEADEKKINDLVALTV